MEQNWRVAGIENKPTIKVSNTPKNSLCRYKRANQNQHILTPPGTSNSYFPAIKRGVENPWFPGEFHLWTSIYKITSLITGSYFKHICDFSWKLSCATAVNAADGIQAVPLRLSRRKLLVGQEAAASWTTEKHKHHEHHAPVKNTYREYYSIIVIWLGNKEI